MRSPSWSGSLGASSAMTLVRVEGEVQRGGEQRLLAAEPVVDHRRVDARAVGDRPDRRAVESAVGELGPARRRGGRRGCPPRRAGGRGGRRGAGESSRDGPRLASSPRARLPRAARPRGAARGATTGRAAVCDDGRMTSAPTSTAGRLGAVSPTREEFRALAVGHRVIPVARRLLADDETPVGVYRKLAGDRPGTFLLESAENGRSWSRWSFVGVHCAAALTERDGALYWLGDVRPACPPRATRWPRCARSSRSCTASRCPGCRR